ncbi:hypothetical protein JB92DRAFT_2826213 [Gautieria morchelliformis]|nr:hypothetical protein JB92DRAFT_2826213 [Gautieria morchelliformis]
MQIFVGAPLDTSCPRRLGFSRVATPDYHDIPTFYESHHAPLTQRSAPKSKGLYLLLGKLFQNNSSGPRSSVPWFPSQKLSMRPPALLIAVIALWFVESLDNCGTKNSTNAI